MRFFNKFRKKLSVLGILAFALAIMSPFGALVSHAATTAPSTATGTFYYYSASSPLTVGSFKADVAINGYVLYDSSGNVLYSGGSLASTYGTNFSTILSNVSYIRFDLSSSYSTSTNIADVYSGNSNTGTDTVVNSTMISTTNPVPIPVTTPPANVTNLTLVDNGTGTFTANWSASTSTNVSSYNLYIKDITTGDTTYNLFGSNTGLTGTSQTFSATAGNDISIKVTSVGSSGAESSGTFIEVNPAPSVASDVTGLIASPVSSTEIDLSWTASSTSGASYSVYNGSTLLTSGLTTTSYNVTGLTVNTSYTFKVVSSASGLTSSSGVTVTSSTSSVAPVTALTATSSNVSTTSDTVSITWTGSGTSGATYNVFDGSTLLQSGVTGTSFTVTGVAPNTSKTYGVIAIVGSSSSSEVTTTLTTVAYADTTPPPVPTSLSGTGGNGYLTASWSSVSASDLAGYNVYINGVKQNSSVVTSTSYTVDSLTNGQSYSVTVSSVDLTGNESLQSTPISLTTSVNAIPLVKTSYHLTDVASGITNWFSSIWLIVAFAVAIPVSFLIASRIKSLFLG